MGDWTPKTWTKEEWKGAVKKTIESMSRAERVSLVQDPVTSNSNWWTQPEYEDEVGRSKEESKVFRDCEDRRNLRLSGIYRKDEGLRDIPTLGPFGRHLNGVQSDRVGFRAFKEHSVSPGTIFTSMELDVGNLRDYPNFKPELSEQELESREDFDSGLEREDEPLDDTEREEKKQEAEFGGEEAWIGHQNTATGLDNRGKDFLGTDGTVGDWTRAWTLERLRDYLKSQSSKLNFGWFGGCKVPESNAILIPASLNLRLAVRSCRRVIVPNKMCDANHTIADPECDCKKCGKNHIDANLPSFKCGCKFRPRKSNLPLFVKPLGWKIVEHRVSGEDIHLEKVHFDIPLLIVATLSIECSDCVICAGGEKEALLTWREHIPTGRLNQHDGLGWEVFESQVYSAQDIQKANEEWEPDVRPLFVDLNHSGFYQWIDYRDSWISQIFFESTRQKTPPRFLGYEWFDRLNSQSLRENKKTWKLLLESGWNAEDWAVVDQVLDSYVRTYPYGGSRGKRWGYRFLEQSQSKTGRLLLIQESSLLRRTIERVNTFEYVTGSLRLAVESGLKPQTVWSEFRDILWESQEKMREEIRKKDRERKPSQWNPEKHLEPVSLDGGKTWIIDRGAPTKQEIRETKHEWKKHCPVCGLIHKEGESCPEIEPIGRKPLGEEQ